MQLGEKQQSDYSGGQRAAVNAAGGEAQTVNTVQLVEKRQRMQLVEKQQGMQLVEKRQPMQLVEAAANGIMQLVEKQQPMASCSWGRSSRGCSWWKSSANAAGGKAAKYYY